MQLGNHKTQAEGEEKLNIKEVSDWVPLLFMALLW